MLWYVTLALFVVWLILVLLGKGGFVHILLLSAVAFGFVQWLADRRAAQQD